MPIKDHNIGGVVERQWARIVTVDTRSRRIEAQLRDFGIVQIALWDVPTSFRWPKEGEQWMIIRENGDWFLRAPAQGSNTSLTIEELEQGDTLIGTDGAKVHFLGELYINGQPLSTISNLAESKGFASHGDDPDTPRPEGFGSVEWQGSVQPNNAIDGDTWFKAEE